MKSYLEKDAFIFSGLKTHAQLAEARSLLKDEKGNIRPYHLFEQDVLKLNEKYNRNYLDAEYQFAVSSSQSAANWANLSDDERYNLQYRTAGDERVRQSHVALNRITLPKKDAFWISYYPPNGWRCRCIAVLVLASKYPASDVKVATEAAEKATTQIGKKGKNKLEMFRFNPGLEKRVFPKGHAYEKVVGAKEISNSDIIPKGLLEIEKKFDYKVPRDLLKHLEVDNFIVTNYNKGAGYTNYGVKSLNVPDNFISRQGLYSRNNVFVHEFGHAIDYQRNLAQRPEVKELMDKYREKYSADRNKLFRSLSNSTKATAKAAMKNNNKDWAEQATDMGDIVKSLNSKFGAGHSTEYYSGALKPEREFLAHCFQIKYNGTGNKFIKRVDPDLHDDMINLLDKILK